MVGRGQMQTRHDPFHYLPRFLRLEAKVAAKSSAKLRDFVRALSGGATPKAEEQEKYYADSATGIPFVRVQNLSVSGQLQLDNVKYVNHETHNGLLARSQVRADDLLVKITGVGRMAVASVPAPGFEGNINQHIARIRTNNRRTSEVLAAWLNTDIAEALAKRRSTGGTRPALDYGALRSIPVIFDESILDAVKAAYRQHAEALTKASKKLEGIDDYLLAELGITLPLEPENTIANRIFMAQRRELAGWRFDPTYFEARFTRLLDAVKKSGVKLTTLRRVCSLLSNGRTPAREGYSETPTDYPIIKVASYTGDLIDLGKVEYATDVQPMSVKCGDIFVLSAAHQPDFVGRFVKLLDEEPQHPTSFVGELICVRANQAVIETDYLFAVLSSPTFQSLVNREKRGQTSHIYPNDIGHLLIPLPKPEVQVWIAEKIRTIREEAKQLRQQAESELETAKRQIEGMLMGEVTP